MLQRSLSILLLLVIIYQQFGSFIQFKLEQYHLKKAVERKLLQVVPEKELTLLSFSQESEEYNNLDWLDDGKEIRYKGKLYDIVKQELQNGVIAIYCIDDTQEEALFYKLNNDVENYLKTSQSSKKSPKTTFKNFIKDYLASTTFQLENTVRNIQVFWSVFNYYTFIPEVDPFSPPKSLSALLFPS